MAKNRKATKKFQRKKLKQTIEKRRKVQKFKKSVDRRQFKRKSSGNEIKNDVNEKDTELSKKSKTEQKLTDSNDEMINEEVVE